MNLTQAAREQAAALTQAAYEEAAAAGLLPAGHTVAGTVDVPGNPEHGDLASSFALAAARVMRRNPIDIAAILAAHLTLDNSYFYAVTPAEPGFLNFTLGSRFYAAVLETVELEGAGGDEQHRRRIAALVSALPPGPFAVLSADAARFFATAPPAVLQTVDLDLAARQDSGNPLYRVAYAHTRICRLIAMAAEDGLRVSPAREVDVSLLNTEAERSLMRTLAALPETLRLAARDDDPSRVNGYLIALADAFYRFYYETRVRGETPAQTAARLKLADTARVVIADGLGLLGIEART